MSYTHLTPSEREKIQILLQCGFSRSAIARQLGRHKSSLSRELRRNGGGDGRYRPAVAQLRYYARRAARPAPKTDNPRLMAYVVARLKECWSPEQIAGRLPLEFPHLPVMRLSPERIYQYIYTDKKRGGALYRYLRQCHKKRRKRLNDRRRRGPIQNRVFLDHRPPEVLRQERVGDWEGDTLVGGNHKAGLGVCVERKTLLLTAAKMTDRKAVSLNHAAQQAMTLIPQRLRKTLTVDNGPEFAAFKALERSLKCPVFFAHPYRAWERPIVENTNGLLRQYLPKKTDFRTVTPDRLTWMVDALNNRPRKKLGYRTPNEVFWNVPVALRC